MPGTFFGLQIGSTGLAAAQIGQDVTGNNIANANTEGYSVQSASQAATDSLGIAGHMALSVSGSLGTGVSVSTIQRASDQFLDTQTRNATSDNSFQTTEQNALTQVNNAFGEPSDTGLNAALGQFFNSFQDIANSPEDLGIRSNTVAQGDAVARIFQSIQQQLTTVSTNLTTQVSTDVQTINDDSTQIAALNQTIRQASSLGQAPNDLLDRRDLLLDKIAGLANITVYTNSDNTVNVSVGNTNLVIGTDNYAVTQSSLTAKGDLTSGELAGLTQSQSKLATYQSQFNTLAASLVSQVNAIHQSGAGLDGTTGLNFFTATAGQEAATIAVNPVLQSNPEKLAAAAAPTPPSTTVSPGDSTNANLLAALENKTITTAGSPLQGKSLLGYYQQTVSDAGGQAASAKTAADSTGAILTQLTQQRSSVTGVNTDTEMLNMMKYQRAYQASAQYIQISDSMIGTLITNLFSAN